MTLEAGEWKCEGTGATSEMRRRGENGEREEAVLWVSLKARLGNYNQ
jgi:hypothetical protein